MDMARLPLYFIFVPMVLGLLGAPIAALICFIIGRIRGLNETHAGTGAWYSMLFILPWLYLALRMLGARISDGAARAGYALFYGLWLYGASVVVIGGLIYLYMMFTGNDAIRIGDIILMVSGGLFILCVWFVSLRRLLRRGEIYEIGAVEPSRPMRIAYTALHALWLLFAVGIALSGMFEATVKDKSDVASVLYIASFVMAAIWIIAMYRFRFSKADDWDYHDSRPHSELPLHDTYINPFIHLYLLITMPALAGIVLWLIMFLFL